MPASLMGKTIKINNKSYQVKEEFNTDTEEYLVLSRKKKRKLTIKDLGLSSPDQLKYSEKETENGWLTLISDFIEYDRKITCAFIEPSGKIYSQLFKFNSLVLENPDFINVSDLKSGEQVTLPRKEFVEGFLLYNDIKDSLKNQGAQKESGSKYKDTADAKTQEILDVFEQIFNKGFK